MDIRFIQNLELRLNKPLPGIDAQNRMAPTGSEKYRQVQPDHKIACVLALLFPKNGVWHLGFIERTSDQPNDKHAGQISLPGGSLSPGDPSFEHCALRETYEEIGVPPDMIGILGNLTPLFVYVSNYVVHPFIGFTTEYPEFTPQPSEVKNILEVPVNHFLDPKNKGLTDMTVRDIILKDTPYYTISGHKLWGATAMIVSELTHVLLNLEEANP
jgi:8-oxo-dGTP pyrophosphatase MutT (NUDIX family)